MADDAVLAFDRGAILQRMIARRIDLASDAHDGIGLRRAKRVPILDARSRKHLRGSDRNPAKAGRDYG
jgi:hypothetical protein